MHTIQLRINEKVYDRFIWLLSKFSKEEIEIVNEDAEFLKVKEYLENELKEIESGHAKFLDQNEFERRINEVI